MKVVPGWGMVTVGRLSTILFLYWIMWLYYQFKYLKNNINMPYFGNWKAITSVVKKACFEHWPYKIWLVSLQSCFGCVAYGFDQINLWMIFISLSSPIDYEKKKSFWHHSLCLLQFHITNLISFLGVSEAICFHAWAGFQFRDKIERLLTKYGALFILFCFLFSKSSFAFNLFKKRSINISRLNASNTGFWDDVAYLIIFSTL